MNELETLLIELDAQQFAHDVARDQHARGLISDFALLAIIGE